MRLFLAIGIVFITSTAYSQESDELFNRIFDEFFINDENATEMEELYQQLYYRYQHPININTATYDNLRELIFLSDQQVQDIIDYRTQNGSFYSIYELQAVPTLNTSEAKILSLFITVDEIALKGETNDYLLVLYDRDLQMREGYRPDSTKGGQTAYLGTPDKISIRGKMTINSRWNAGFLAEKDAGENMIFDNATKRYGFNHYSGYVMYKNDKIDKLIIGDYQLQFGQGLAYSSGFSIGKSAGEIASFRRMNIGIRPHTSSMEAGFLRGVAASYYIRNFKVIPFFSYRQLDASVDPEQNSFASINASGLHRTRSEVLNKQSVTEKTGGLMVSYQKDKLDAGIGFSLTNLSAQWLPTDRLYNLKSFRGRNLNLLFSNFNYRIRNINLFSEQSLALNGGMAVVGGVLINLSRSVETGLIYRNYSPGYASLYGSGLGEKSSNNNEKGMLWLTNWRIKRNLNLSFFFDHFSFPWLSYRISKPAAGYDFLLRLKYNITRSSYLLAQYKEEQKPQDVEGQNMVIVQDNVKRNYQLVVHYPINDQIILRSRMQGSNSTLSDGKGFAILQDLFYKQNNISVTLRYALFNVDDFENRLYTYENDVLYSFNFPALQGKGRRFYAILKYNVAQNIKIWIRYSNTSYSDRNEISSGNELIRGNSLSEIKLQLMYKL